MSGKRTSYLGSCSACQQVLRGGKSIFAWMSYKGLLWVGCWLWAQPLPNEILFQKVGGDSMKALCQTFSGGWLAEVHQRIGTAWQAVQRDSFFIDTLRRLRGYVRYDILPSGIERPAERWRIDYPQQRGLSVCTIERYDTLLGTFVPRQRLYLWGAPTRWDSVLRGWIGVLGLAWRLDEGALLMPQPTLSEIALWGDSLLIEAYLPELQVYVGIGGYVRKAGGNCDTVLWYEFQGSQRIPQGWRILCPSSGNALTYSHDSLCSSTGCAVEERFFFYDTGGQMVLDSLIVRAYDSQGQLVSSGVLLRRYEWDAARRLSRAFYPGGNYKLTYNGQVVSLSHSPRKNAEWQPGEVVSMYDWQMRLVWQGEVGTDGHLRLPEGLAAGIYFLRWGEKVRKIAIVPP